MKIFSIHRTDSSIFFFITRLFWNSRQKKLVNHGIEGKVCTHTRLKRRRDIINFPINSVFMLYLYISWNEIKKRYLQFRIKKLFRSLNHPPRRGRSPITPRASRHYSRRQGAQIVALTFVNSSILIDSCAGIISSWLPFVSLIGESSSKLAPSLSSTNLDSTLSSNNRWYWFASR